MAINIWKARAVVALGLVRRKGANTWLVNVCSYVGGYHWVFRAADKRTFLCVEANPLGETPCPANYRGKLCYHVAAVILYELQQMGATHIAFHYTRAEARRTHRRRFAFRVAPRGHIFYVTYSPRRAQPDDRR